MSGQAVSCEWEEQFVIIKIDDGKANALSPVVFEQLFSALDEAESKQSTVIITGREGKFSGGFDLSILMGGGQGAIDLLLAGANLAKRFLQFPYPVIIANPGHAIAMAAFLLLSADYRLSVSSDAKIGLNETAIGLTLPKFGIELGYAKVTKNYFNRSIIQAEIFSPELAMRAGYVDELVEEKKANFTCERESFTTQFVRYESV